MSRTFHIFFLNNAHTHARTRKLSSYYAGDWPSFNLLCLFSGVDLAKLSQIISQEIHGIRWQTNFSHKILSIFIYNENDSWTFLANAARENYKNVLLSFCFDRWQRSFPCRSLRWQTKSYSQKAPPSVATFIIVEFMSPRLTHVLYDTIIFVAFTFRGQFSILLQKQWKTALKV